MGPPTRRQPQLPNLGEWFESFPVPTGWRSLAQLHGIRLEDFVEGDQYVVRAELPGIDPEKDLEITVQRGVLTLRCERREQREEKGRSEFRYGSLARSVRLPEGARDDDVKASYKDGILTVRVGLGQPSAGARKITVARGE